MNQSIAEIEGKPFSARVRSESGRNEEIWKPIKGYEGRYEVSSRGRVKSFCVLKCGKIMTPSKNLNSYHYVHLYSGKNRSVGMIARLVAESFLKDYSEDLEVDHINGDKENNDVSNLRMVDRAANSMGYQKKRESCSSAYRGVCWIKSRNKWRASLQSKHCFVIKEFKTELEAAIAYNGFIEKYGFPVEALNIIRSNES